MDAFLGGLTKQAMNYAIRSGITITANYVFQQSTKLITKVNGQQRANLLQLQQQLDDQMRIISPAIDMIELISARGNTSLESAKFLTGSIREQIQALGHRIAQAVTLEDGLSHSSKAQQQEEADAEVRSIIIDIKSLLRRLDFAVPLFNLAITASGANLSGTLPTTVSPSRLLQASTFLSAGDALYNKKKSGPIQIGPAFNLSLYMLFNGHARPTTEEDVRQTTWKEVIHKARLKLMRVPLEDLYSLSNHHETAIEKNKDFASSSSRCDEYAYQIVIVEDLEDDRVHTYEDNEQVPTSFQEVHLAGLRDVIPVHEISKIFYADTGKILNIGQDGEINNPILLLRRDIHAQAPRRMMSQFDYALQDGGSSDFLSSETVTQKESRKNVDDANDSTFNSNAWKLPQYLDPEWLAFEVYTECDDSDDESYDSGNKGSRRQSTGPQLVDALSALDLNRPASAESTTPGFRPTIRTSLSLLEVLLRLLSLQQFQQMSHLSVSDELLNFFLSEAATTGAKNGDDIERRKIRNEARVRLGFDPYDESPIKRRGEDYQYRYQAGREETIPKEEMSADSESTTPVSKHGVGRPSTPHSLLDNRPRLSPDSTPDLPPLPRSTSSSPAANTTPTGAARFRAIQERVRRNSPLASKANVSEANSLLKDD